MSAGLPATKQEELMRMAKQLEGKRVAFLFTEGAEQVEVTEPLNRP